MENSQPDLNDCYRTLGLARSASLEEIKITYRKLVKQYHPDYNPDRQAVEQFIRINYAYETLLAAFKQPQSAEPAKPKTSQQPYRSEQPPEPPELDIPIVIHVKKRSTASSTSTLTPAQQQQKQQALEQILALLQQGHWLQAARQAENLGASLPNDPDVNQVRARAYHGWARALLDRRQYDAARSYLQQAMKADPTNRYLWEEIERDYIRIERGLKL